MVRAFESKACKAISVWVSILVVLDHWFGHGDGISFLDNSYWVSILVVLDHWFGRWNAIYGAAYQRLFQSLLFWIIGSGLPTRAGATTATRRFNPCCFGSLVRASWLAELQWAADVGFNPCCFGSLVRARPSIGPLFYHRTFQSLLFWIIGSGSKAQVHSLASHVVSILVVLDHWFGLVLAVVVTLVYFVFQSLLFWIIGSG